MRRMEAWMRKIHHTHPMIITLTPARIPLAVHLTQCTYPTLQPTAHLHIPERQVEGHCGSDGLQVLP